MTSGSNTSNQLGRISEALLYTSRCSVLPPWNKTILFLRILIKCWWNKFEIPLLRSVALNCQSYQYRFLKLNLTDRVEMYPNCVLSIIWVTISKFSISNLQSRTEIYLIDPPPVILYFIFSLQQRPYYLVDVYVFAYFVQISRCLKIKTVLRQTVESSNKTPRSLKEVAPAQSCDFHPRLLAILVVLM